MAKTESIEALAGLTEARARTTAGGNGGSQLAGVDSHKYADARALGAGLVVLGYGEVPAKARSITRNSDGSKVAKSYIGAQITQGVMLETSSGTQHWVGYGEFADYIAPVLEASLIIGVKGKIIADGKVSDAPTLAALLKVADSTSRRGSATKWARTFAAADLAQFNRKAVK